MKNWKELDDERRKIESDHGYVSTVVVCSTAPDGTFAFVPPPPSRAAKQENCKGCGAPLSSEALGICDYCGFGKVVVRR